MGRKREGPATKGDAQVGGKHFLAREHWGGSHAGGGKRACVRAMPLWLAGVCLGSRGLASFAAPTLPTHPPCRPPPTTPDLGNQGAQAGAAGAAQGRKDLHTHGQAAGRGHGVRLQAYISAAAAWHKAAAPAVDGGQQHGSPATVRGLLSGASWLADAWALEAARMWVGVWQSVRWPTAARWRAATVLHAGHFFALAQPRQAKAFGLWMYVHTIVWANWCGRALVHIHASKGSASFAAWAGVLGVLVRAQEQRPGAWQGDRLAGQGSAKRLKTSMEAQMDVGRLTGARIAGACNWGVEWARAWQLGGWILATECLCVRVCECGLTFGIGACTSCSRHFQSCHICLSTAKNCIAQFGQLSKALRLLVWLNMS